MLVFCFVSALLFLILALFNLRKGFYVYLASLPLLPAYIAIPLVKGGAGISLNRMMTYALAVALVVAIINKKQLWLPVIHRILKWPAFLFWAICLFLAKFISTIMNQDSIVLFYWLDEFVGVSVVYMLAARYVTNITELRTVLKVLLSALLLQLCVVFIETLSQQPILHGIVEINVSTVSEKVSEGFERGGTYRALGLFDNPLSLAEYLLVGCVLMLGAYKLNGSKRPVLFYLGVAVVLLAISYTGARFSLIALVLALFVSTVFYYGYRLPSLGRPVFLIVSTALFSSLGYFAYLAITDVYWFLEILNTYAGEDASGTASVISRASQYLIIPTEIFGNASSGILGEGLRSDIMQRLDTRLDNYYLRVLIEGGALGLISFAALIVTSFVHVGSHANYKYLGLRYAHAARFLLIFFFAIFAVNKFFLSMSFNNQYFFLFAGIALSLLPRKENSRKYWPANAYSARS